MKETEIKIRVFRTSLQNKEAVDLVSGILNNHPSVHDWNVDLEDWEKVLRVEYRDARVVEISEILRREGVEIDEMPI
ncbi:MAG: hypothetical protein WD016_07355 [Balneolaceae bacterium]